MKDKDPVIGMMYRPAALTFIGGFIVAATVGLESGFIVMLAGIVWDEVHWRTK